MTPCKHLDYETHYVDCRIETCEPHYPAVQFWRRLNPPVEGAPTRVQFCKKRGRINEIFACYNGEMSCYEPQEQKGE